MIALAIKRGSFFLRYDGYHFMISMVSFCDAGYHFISATSAYVACDSKHVRTQSRNVGYHFMISMVSYQFAMLVAIL